MHSRRVRGTCLQCRMTGVPETLETGPMSSPAPAVRALIAQISRMKLGSTLARFMVHRHNAPCQTKTVSLSKKTRPDKGQLLCVRQTRRHASIMHVRNLAFTTPLHHMQG